MDTLIKFVEVEGFLKNPPSIAPHSDFTCLRTLRCHMIEVLKQLSFPQSAIDGWGELVMHPMMHALIKMVPFQIPNNPGNVPTLPSFAEPVAIKSQCFSLKVTSRISHLTRTSTMHASKY
jgi:hypothetical protein